MEFPPMTGPPKEAGIIEEPDTIEVLGIIEVLGMKLTCCVCMYMCVVCVCVKSD
jgi:hypothetical protein